MALQTIKIKPSLYIIIDDERKIPLDTEEKKIVFFYVIKTKNVIMEAEYFNKHGRHFWPFCIINPHDTKEIYKLCIELFEKMKDGNYSETSEKGINLIEYLNVKTFAGAVRKLEFYSFDWNKDYGYFFCKGERNTNGYSWYRDYIIGNEIKEDEFYKGYNKMLNRIERKLLRKEMKKENK